MEKFLLEDFAGGAVAERIGSAIQRVYENIANPNMDAEKARKLTIELTFKPDKNDRTDVDVTAIVKTSLQPGEGNQQQNDCGKRRQGQRTGERMAQGSHEGTAGD